LILLLPGRVCEALDLQVGTARVPGGEFRFRTDFSEPVDQLPFAVQGDDVEVVSTPEYNVYIDLDEIRPTKYGSFRYVFFARPAHAAGGPLTSFVVHGEPAGSFLAQMAETDLLLSDGDRVNAQKRIQLPIFSFESGPYLESVSWTVPQDVELAGETEVRIPLKNLLPKWPVSVLAVRVAKSKQMWQQATLLMRGSEETRPFDLKPAETLDDALTLHLEPAAGRAFVKALFARDRKKEHDSIGVSIDYDTQWGLRRTLEVQVPVRFVPWPPLLFLAVGSGTLLGSMAPVLAGRRKRVRWPKAFAASLVTGIVVELIAILMVQLNSEVRILGFDLDPFQLLPALLIGIVSGLMGFRSLDLVKGWLARGVSPTEEA
jgi:hypothetical protein